MRKGIFVVALFLIGAGCTNDPIAAPSLPSAVTTVSVLIDGQSIVLGGKTRAFGQPVYGDPDGDGDQDAALLIEQDSEGSGTFYYVAVAMNEGNGYRGTNAVLLGDRVAPQNVEVRDSGLIIANYADRKPGEPFTARPSVGVSKYLRVEGQELKETAKP